MGLKNLTSQLDLVPGNNPVGDMETTPSIDLAGAFDQGETSTLKQDSLENIYQSAINPGATYGAGQPGATWPSVNPPPIGTNFADLNGIDGGNGFFHDVNNPQIGQGKKLKGQDLHVYLLERQYAYSYGKGSNLSLAKSPEGEGGINGGAYDLNGGLPNNGTYKENGPSDGFY